jgi:hypothetical protein
VVGERKGVEIEQSCQELAVNVAKIVNFENVTGASPTEVFSLVAKNEKEVLSEIFYGVFSPLERPSSFILSKKSTQTRLETIALSSYGLVSALSGAAAVSLYWPSSDSSMLVNDLWRTTFHRWCSAEFAIDLWAEDSAELLRRPSISSSSVVRETPSDDDLESSRSDNVLTDAQSRYRSLPPPIVALLKLACTTWGKLLRVSDSRVPLSVKKEEEGSSAANDDDDGDQRNKVDPSRSKLRSTTKKVDDVFVLTHDSVVTVRLLLRSSLFLDVSMGDFLKMELGEEHAAAAESSLDITAIHPWTLADRVAMATRLLIRCVQNLGPTVYLTSLQMIVAFIVDACPEIASPISNPEALAILILLLRTFRPLSHSQSPFIEGKAEAPDGGSIASTAKRVFDTRTVSRLALAACENWAEERTGCPFALFESALQGGHLHLAQKVFAVAAKHRSLHCHNKEPPPPTTTITTTVQRCRWLVDPQVVCLAVSCACRHGANSVSASPSSPSSNKKKTVLRPSPEQSRRFRTCRNLIRE